MVVPCSLSLSPSHIPNEDMTVLLACCMFMLSQSYSKHNLIMHLESVCATIAVLLPTQLISLQCATKAVSLSTQLISTVCH